MLLLFSLTLMTITFSLHICLDVSFHYESDIILTRSLTTRGIAENDLYITQLADITNKANGTKLIINKAEFFHMYSSSTRFYRGDNLDPFMYE